MFQTDRKPREKKWVENGISTEAKNKTNQNIHLDDTIRNTERNGIFYTDLGSRTTYKTKQT